MTDDMKKWAKAAAVRAVKTAAQSAIAAIGATTTMGAGSSPRMRGAQHQGRRQEEG